MEIAGYAISEQTVRDIYKNTSYSDYICITIKYKI